MLLVCRNSTDTAYFQRLRPYPRVLLRRTNTLFKDYDKTPIGFGIVVFCIAKEPCSYALSCCAAMLGRGWGSMQGCSSIWRRNWRPLMMHCWSGSCWQKAWQNIVFT